MGFLKWGKKKDGKYSDRGSGGGDEPPPTSQPGAAVASAAAALQHPTTSSAANQKEQVLPGNSPQKPRSGGSGALHHQMEQGIRKLSMDSGEEVDEGLEEVLQAKVAAEKQRLLSGRGRGGGLVTGSGGGGSVKSGSPVGSDYEQLPGSMDRAAQMQQGRTDFFFSVAATHCCRSQFIEVLLEVMVLLF